MKMETTLKTLHIPNSGIQGVLFIGTREEGAREQPLAQNATAVATVRPRFCGHTRAARATLRAVRGPICPLSSSGPDCWKLAPGFDKTAFQS